MITLGSYLITALQDAGVRHVFGIPGIHNLELYRALHGSSMTYISARHEQGLGFMADGYARVAGRVAACFTISGPGVGNILTSLGQAYGDSIPILVIASQNRRREAGSGRGFLHELPDQRALAAGVTAASFTIDTSGQLPLALARAFEIFLSARPRPVYIGIPMDVLAADAAGLPALQIATNAYATTVDEADLQAAARLLQGAQRPVVVAGGGAVRAAGPLRALVERLRAPLVMTTNARGLLPPGHALAVPFSPSLPAVRALLAQADVVLAVGTELGPTDFDMYSESEFPPPVTLIRIDIDAQQLQRNATARVALLGDAAQLLATLLPLLAGSPVPHATTGEERAAASREQSLQGLPPLMRKHLELLELIRDTVPDAIIVGDSTQLVYAGDLAFAAATPGSWFNSATGFGTLGYALPASTGASVAAPDRPVICLVGDGGLQFSLAELAVLREARAWSAILVWNNHGYGEIRSAMVAAGIQPLGVDGGGPDLQALSSAYDLAYRRIASAAQLRTALKDFASKRRCVLMELVERDLIL